VRGIVVHTTVGGIDSAIAWFANPASGVSAHYLVGLDGRVVQFVAEADTARHAGRVKDPTTPLVDDDDDPNLYTIGIEFEDGGDPEGVHRPDAQYEAGGRLIGAVARRGRIPLDRDHVIGHREVFAAKSCPGNLDIERLIREAASMARTVCLLPARNAAADLPGWLESAERVAGAVVALDDGSTDATAEILEASSLVAKLLSNPPREGYEGWDDARNRSRLLASAADLDPEWVIFLDADERIDREDAAALRSFIATDAIPGCAYGLELHRMWGAHLADAAYNWVFRLFAGAPGLELPQRRLHFNPVPTSIARRAWVRTTIRIRHLDSPGRLAERRSKYELADQGRADEHRPARLLDEPPPERLVPWRRREPGQPVLDPDRVAARTAASESRTEARATAASPQGPGPELLCLLPVRNGAADLPGYLESAGRFCDGVVALDDGSTDATAGLLEESPLVVKTISSAARPSYAGWDDAANRARLLAAAAELEPRWILQLDADERIDPDDANALREFLADQAEPGHAYGFRVFRMIDDLEHFDEAGLWVYRLFAYECGQRMPTARLHFVPVPDSIPRERWRRTTIRIQHLGGLTEPRRQARFAKYEEVDPAFEYQSHYRYVTRPPQRVRPWRKRPPGFPVLADPLQHGFWKGVDLEDLDLDAPLLSAIVISRNDEDRIERAVRSVAEQRCEQPFEVIVVVSGDDRTAEIVREKFPGVRLVELEGVALPGRARNAGVHAARGDYVSFPGSHVELPPGSLEARLRAHERGYPMVTGSMVNGAPTLSGWASYFLDHSGSLPGRLSGELDGPPAHCSYVREFLLDAGGFRQDLRAGEDTVVNRTLFNRGHRAYREQGVRLIHRSRCTNPWRLVCHHFGRGRGWGRIVIDDHRGGRRLLRWRPLSFMLVRYVPSRLWRTSRQVRRWGGELRPRYRHALPLVAAGVLAAWVGLWFEILRPRRGKLRVLLADQRNARKPPVASADEDVLAVDRPRDGVVSEGGGREAGVDEPELLERRT
jgi:glycosyltransferase involved in cell wall biosynthesis